jgi:MinD superfamily P-loop ATPase
MQIAIASGKGGTGKTTIALNLAHISAREGHIVQYIDCDVEEPNGHIFLHPEIERSTDIGILVPEIDNDKCNGCGLCQEICQFNAIACFGKQVLVFPELCHGCGGCMQVCPEKAITEESRAIGVVETGSAVHMGFIQGRLNIGEAMSPPLIRGVKKEVQPHCINILDAPPGTSCPVITVLNDADFVVLVTEPTPFGLNDLGLALDMINELGRPFGVVVNRHDTENALAREFCKTRKAPILAEIPDDRRIAEAYSVGKLACDAVPGYDTYFSELWKKINTPLL